MRTSKWSVVSLLLLMPLAPAMAQDEAAIPPLNAKGDTRTAFEFKDHPSLRLGDIARIDGIVKLQLDGRKFSDGSDTDGWDLHRARVGVGGHLFRVVDYQLERELNDDTSAWRDVYLNLGAFPSLEVRAGQFKIPFSLDQLTGATDLDFAFRSRAAASLAPGRDVGVMVHGRLIRRTLRYDVGVFRRGGENVTNAERSEPISERTVAIRVTVTPWRATKSAIRNLTFGGGTTVGHLPTGLNNVRGRTVADEPLSQRLFVSGNRRRLGADVDWRHNSIGVHGEVMRVIDQRLGQGTDDDDLPALHADGAYVSGTWIVTGEKKADDLRPRRPLLQGGIGAIEFAGRVERLDIGTGGAGDIAAGPRARDVANRGARAITLGLNWYLNRFVRVQANVVREHQRQAGVPSQQNPSSWVRLVRLQLAL